ncbi:MAG: hypothetical protein AAFO79_01705 [Pseudomonadota bacterium]
MAQTTDYALASEQWTAVATGPSRLYVQWCSLGICFADVRNVAPSIHTEQAGHLLRSTQPPLEMHLEEGESLYCRSTRDGRIAVTPFPAGSMLSVSVGESAI